MFINAILSVFIVSLISLIGAFFLSKLNKNLEKYLPILVAMSVGAMFGDSFIHLLPEATEEIGNPLFVGIGVLLGIVTFFVLEKFLRWHHCHHGSDNHDHSYGSEKKPHHIAPLVLFSDSLHNFIDGVIIAAGFLISLPVGFATTIAVVLHEIPQEIGDFGLLIHSGYSIKKALLFNFLSALASFLGVVFVFILFDYVEFFVPYMAAFAAGSFIYIAGSDLVPELHKHTSIKDSFVQLIATVLGIFIMALLLLLE